MRVEDLDLVTGGDSSIDFEIDKRASRRPIPWRLQCALFPASH